MISWKLAITSLGEQKPSSIEPRMLYFLFGFDFNLVNNVYLIFSLIPKTIYVQEGKTAVIALTRPQTNGDFSFHQL